MPKIIYHDSDGVDKAVNLGSEPILIGRATECQIQTQDAMVSRRHARISWDGSYIVEDLGSSNGVYVGSEKVTRAPIRPGDTVTCGSLVLKLMPDTSPRQSERSLHNVEAPAILAPPMAAPPMAPPFAFANAAPPPQLPTPSSALPPMAPPPSVQVGPNAVLRGSLAPPSTAGATAPHDMQLAIELDGEKRRRSDAEGALLEAEARVNAAEERARAAEARATEAENTSRDAHLLKRKVDQLTADLRRMRGGKDPDPAPEPSGDGDRQARLTAESERDRLRQRVADLEAELANAGGVPASAAPATEGADTIKLRRQVDQLTAELRRMRGGQPADGGGDAARVAELTAELRRAEAERDGFKAQASRAPAVAKTDPAAADAAIALSDALAELRSSLRAATDEAGLLTAPSESVTVVGDALRSAGEQLESAREQLRKLAKLLGVA